MSKLAWKNFKRNMPPRKTIRPAVVVVAGPNADVANGVDEDVAVMTVVDEAVTRRDMVNATRAMINVSFVANTKNFNNID